MQKFNLAKNRNVQKMPSKKVGKKRPQGRVIRDATNLLGGTAGNIVFQIDTNKTAFIPPPIDSGLVLESSPNGFGWQSTNQFFKHSQTAANKYQIPVQPVNNGDITTFIDNSYAGFVLQSNGSNAPPSFVDKSSPSFVVGSANYAENAANLLGGIDGSIVYQKNSETTGFINPPVASNSILVSQDEGFAWQSANQFFKHSANNIYQIPVQPLNNGDITFIDNQNAGFVLQSNGPQAPPSFVDPTSPSFFVGFANNCYHADWARNAENADLLTILNTTQSPLQNEPAGSLKTVIFPSPSQTSLINNPENFYSGDPFSTYTLSLGSSYLFNNFSNKPVHLIIPGNNQTNYNFNVNNPGPVIIPSNTSILLLYVIFDNVQNKPYWSRIQMN